MKILVSALLLSILPVTGFSAEAITAVYDNNSFRIGITLPFVVESLKTRPTAEISGLSIQAGDAESVAAVNSCSLAKDKFIRTNFLLKCKEPGTYKVVVDVLEGSQVSIINFGPIKIVELKPGYKEPEEVVTVDPEIAEGKNILYTKYDTSGANLNCIACHGTPGTQGLRSKATVAILQNLKSKSAMANVPNLTAAEAKKVMKYLNTIKDDGIWP